MGTITPINAAYTQNLAFRGNEETQKQERHPFKAALSVPLPGSGEILNGDTKSGLKHLGISAALFASIIGLSKKIIKPNLEIGSFIPKGAIPKLACIAVPLLAITGLANVATSIKSAYKGKENLFKEA